MILQWIFGVIYAVKMCIVWVGVDKMGVKLAPPRSNRKQIDLSHSIVSFQGIEHRQTDWKTFLINKLVGAKTLPDNFRQKVKKKSSISSSINLNLTRFNHHFDVHSNEI